tara:strand:- start:301 stop:585 length:285 start_codon:yes stop_codon:yes gene_type:complete
MNVNTTGKRTPDEIRDDEVRAFNQLAPAKYNEGQRRQEVTPNLDDHPDLVGAIREEIIDAWFYAGSLAAQLNKKDERIAELEAALERWKGVAKR